MKTNNAEDIDCYSSEAMPRARTCLCAAWSGDKPVAALGARASGRCRLDPLPPDEPGAGRQGRGAGKRGLLQVGSVPVKESLTLWLSAPFSPSARARKVFPALLDIALPFPLEKCVYQILDVRRMPDRTTGALAVAARRDRVKAILQRYRDEGFDPEILDHEGLALWTQSLREIPVQPGFMRAVLHLGVERATLVVGKADRFTDSHSLEFGAGSGSTDSFVELIQRHLRAEIEPETPVEWAFCGPEAENSSMVANLHGKLSKEWPGPCILHDAPESFLLRALGTRALFREPLRCNLRCGDLIHKNITRAARRLAVSGAALIFASGLLLLGINAVWHIAHARRFERLKREVATLASSVAPGEFIPYGMEKAEVEKVMDRHAEETAPFIDAFSPSPALRLAGIVRAARDCGVRIETLSLRRDGISIAGTAEDWDRCELFARRLRAMEYAVELDRREAVADGPVRFTVKGDAVSR